MNQEKIRLIKFRQPLFLKDKFHSWHYWGFVKEREFVSPEKSWVQGSTSQEFTGLKDKSGTEIYEGDIANITYTILNPPEEGKKVIETRITERGVMMFNQESAQFSFFLENSILDENMQNFEIKVIGNIYEHPKLLPTLSSKNGKKENNG